MKGLKPSQWALSLIWTEHHILIYILNHLGISIFTLLYLLRLVLTFGRPETSEGSHAYELLPPVAQRVPVKGENYVVFHTERSLFKF